MELHQFRHFIKFIKLSGISAARRTGACLCITLLGCLSILPSHARPLTIASSHNLSTADPHAFNNVFANAILSSIYQPLLRFHPKTFHHEGVLAQSWQLLNSQTIRFSLRPKVYFHEGQRLHASDVAFSIQRAAHPSSAFKSFATGIREIRVLNPLLLELHFDGHYSILLNQLTKLPIINQAWAREQNLLSPSIGSQVTLFKANGTGLYRLQDWGSGNRIVLQKDKRSWLASPSNNVDTVIYKQVSDPQTRLTLLRDKSVDVSLGIPNSPEAIRTVAGLSVREQMSNAVAFVGLNVSTPTIEAGDNKLINPLRDVRVRQALSRAIDPQELQNANSTSRLKTTHQIITSAVNGWNSEWEKSNPFDLTLAKKLLSQSSHPKGFTLPFVCPNNRVDTCKAIAKMWARLGVELKIETMPISELVPKMVAGKVAAYALGWSTFTFDAQYVLENLFYTSPDRNEKNHNGSQYNNPQVNFIIEQLRSSKETARRNKLIQEAFAIIYRDVPVIPLYVTLDTVALQRNVDFPFVTDYTPDWAKLRFK